MTPIKINSEHTVEIIDLTFRGKGVSKVDDFTIFVDDAIPGDVVRIIVYDVKKTYALASLIEIINPSHDRAEILDERLDTIPLQHLNYQKQLEYKQKWIYDTLRRAVNIQWNQIEKTMGMEDPWHYRNKAQIPTRMVNGQLETGIFKAESNTFIPVENYYIQDKVIDETLMIIKRILNEFHVLAYNPKDKSGFLRHIIIRKGHMSHELMVIFVTQDKAFPLEREIVQAILEKCPNVVSIIQNINVHHNNIVMGPHQRVLFGGDIYMDELMGLKISISSKSFLQVNSIQTEKLYQHALELANIKKDEVWLDAFCGIGTITLVAASYAKHVYGIEVVKDAIKMANINKSINQISNVTFEVGKAEKLIKNFKNLDGVIVDPPRAGLDSKFIDSILESKPKTFIYISCNPQTLARDLKRLTEVYIIEKVQPIDMFPQTLHVECVVSLIRK